MGYSLKEQITKVGKEISELGQPVGGTAVKPAAWQEVEQKVATEVANKISALGSQYFVPKAASVEEVQSVTDVLLQGKSDDPAARAAELLGIRKTIDKQLVEPFMWSVAVCAGQKAISSVSPQINEIQKKCVELYTSAIDATEVISKQISFSESGEDSLSTQMSRLGISELDQNYIKITAMKEAIQQLSQSIAKSAAELLKIDTTIATEGELASSVDRADKYIQSVNRSSAKLGFEGQIIEIDVKGSPASVVVSELLKIVDEHASKDDKLNFVKLLKQNTALKNILKEKRNNYTALFSVCPTKSNLEESINQFLSAYSTLPQALESKAELTQDEADTFFTKFSELTKASAEIDTDLKNNNTISSKDIKKTRESEQKEIVELQKQREQLAEKQQLSQTLLLSLGERELPALAESIYAQNSALKALKTAVAERLNSFSEQYFGEEEILLLNSQELCKFGLYLNETYTALDNMIAQVRNQAGITPQFIQRLEAQRDYVGSALVVTVLPELRRRTESAFNDAPTLEVMGDLAKTVTKVEVTPIAASKLPKPSATPASVKLTPSDFMSEAGNSLVAKELSETASRVKQENVQLTPYEVAQYRAISKIEAPAGGEAAAAEQAISVSDVLNVLSATKPSQDNERLKLIYSQKSVAQIHERLQSQRSVEAAAAAGQTALDFVKVFAETYGITLKEMGKAQKLAVSPKEQTVVNVLHDEKGKEQEDFYKTLATKSANVGNAVVLRLLIEQILTTHMQVYEYGNDKDKDNRIDCLYDQHFIVSHDGQKLSREAAKKDFKKDKGERLIRYTITYDPTYLPELSDINHCLYHMNQLLQALKISNGQIKGEISLNAFVAGLGKTLLRFDKSGQMITHVDESCVEKAILSFTQATLDQQRRDLRTVLDYNSNALVAAKLAQESIKGLSSDIEEVKKQLRGGDAGTGELIVALEQRQKELTDSAQKADAVSTSGKPKVVGDELSSGQVKLENAIAENKKLVEMISTSAELQQRTRQELTAIYDRMIIGYRQNLDAECKTVDSVLAEQQKLLESLAKLKEEKIESTTLEKLQSLIGTVQNFEAKFESSKGKIALTITTQENLIRSFARILGKQEDCEKTLKEIKEAYKESALIARKDEISKGADAASKDIFSRYNAEQQRIAKELEENKQKLKTTTEELAKVTSDSKQAAKVAEEAQQKAAEAQQVVKVAEEAQRQAAQQAAQAAEEAQRQAAQQAVEAAEAQKKAAEAKRQAEEEQQELLKQQEAAKQEAFGALDQAIAKNNEQKTPYESRIIELEETREIYLKRVEMACYQQLLASFDAITSTIAEQAAAPQAEAAQVAAEGVKKIIDALKEGIKDKSSKGQNIRKEEVDKQHTDFETELNDKLTKIVDKRTQNALLGLAEAARRSFLYPKDEQEKDQSAKWDKAHKEELARSALPKMVLECENQILLLEAKNESCRQTKEQITSSGASVLAKQEMNIAAMKDQCAKVTSALDSAFKSYQDLMAKFSKLKADYSDLSKDINRTKQLAEVQAMLEKARGVKATLSSAIGKVESAGGKAKEALQHIDKAIENLQQEAAVLARYKEGSDQEIYADVVKYFNEVTKDALVVTADKVITNPPDSEFAIMTITAYLNSHDTNADFKAKVILGALNVCTLLRRDEADLPESSPSHKEIKLRRKQIIDLLIAYTLAKDASEKAPVYQVLIGKIKAPVAASTWRIVNFFRRRRTESWYDSVTKEPEKVKKQYDTVFGRGLIVPKEETSEQKTERETKYKAFTSVQPQGPLYRLVEKTRKQNANLETTKLEAVIKGVGRFAGVADGYVIAAEPANRFLSSLRDMYGAQAGLQKSLIEEKGSYWSKFKAIMETGAGKAKGVLFLASAVVFALKGVLGVGGAVKAGLNRQFGKTAVKSLSGVWNLSWATYTGVKGIYALSEETPEQKRKRMKEHGRSKLEQFNDVVSGTSSCLGAQTIVTDYLAKSQGILDDVVNKMEAQQTEIKEALTECNRLGSPDNVTRFEKAMLAGRRSRVQSGAILLQIKESLSIGSVFSQAIDIAIEEIGYMKQVAKKNANWFNQSLLDRAIPAEDQRIIGIIRKRIIAFYPEPSKVEAFLEALEIYLVALKKSYADTRARVDAAIAKLPPEDLAVSQQVLLDMKDQVAEQQSNIMEGMLQEVTSKYAPPELKTVADKVGAAGAKLKEVMQVLWDPVKYRGQVKPPVGAEAGIRLYVMEQAANQFGKDVSELSNPNATQNILKTVEAKAAVNHLSGDAPQGKRLKAYKLPVVDTVSGVLERTRSHTGMVEYVLKNLAKSKFVFDDRRKELRMEEGEAVHTTLLMQAVLKEGAHFHAHKQVSHTYQDQEILVAFIDAALLDIDHMRNKIYAQESYKENNLDYKDAIDYLSSVETTLKNVQQQIKGDPTELMRHSFGEMQETQLEKTMGDKTEELIEKYIAVDVTATPHSTTEAIAQVIGAPAAAGGVPAAEAPVAAVPVGPAVPEVKVAAESAKEAASKFSPEVDKWLTEQVEKYKALSKDDKVKMFQDVSTKATNPFVTREAGRDPTHYTALKIRLEEVNAPEFAAKAKPHSSGGGGGVGGSTTMVAG